MSDHRRLQRTLFRMQADAGFARAILGRDEAALATTGLEGDDLALLEAVDAPSLTADPGGKRRTQIAGNAASEYLLTLVLAARERQGKDFLDGFLTSPEFHGAMAADGRLPLAFGAYATRWAEEHAAAGVGALAALERAMAALRRDARAAAPRLNPGDVQLSPCAAVVRVPSGTLAWSVALRQRSSSAPRSGHESCPPETGNSGLCESPIAMSASTPCASTPFAVTSFMCCENLIVRTRCGRGRVAAGGREPPFLVPERGLCAELSPCQVWI